MAGDSYCTAIIIGVVLFAMILVLVYSGSQTQQTSTPTPTMSNESYDDNTVDNKRADNFLKSNVLPVYPYNYWYLTAYPQYLQSWKWGKGLPECTDPDAYYPYYWPHNGRGWALTGYGRRQ